MKITAVPLASHPNFELYYVRFKATSASSWTVNGDFPVSLFFCTMGSRATLTMGGSVLSDPFLTRNRGNILYRTNNPTHLTWDDASEVEFIEIRLRKEYLTSLTGTEAKEWGDLFNLTSIRKGLLAAAKPLRLSTGLVQVLNSIVLFSRKPVVFQQLIFEARALELVALFLAQLQAPVLAPALPAKHNKLAILAKKYIDSNKGKKEFTVIGLAQQLGTNETTLKQAFKATYGKTMFRYFQEKNMQAALEALQDGQSIAEVASKFGYSYVSHFTHAFKKEFGVTPARFR